MSTGIKECIEDKSETGWGSIMSKHLSEYRTPIIDSNFQYPELTSSMQNKFEEGLTIGLFEEQFSPCFYHQNGTYEGFSIELLQECILPKIAAHYQLKNNTIPIKIEVFEEVNNNIQFSFVENVASLLNDERADMFVCFSHLLERAEYVDFSQYLVSSYSTCARSEYQPDYVIDSKEKINNSTITVSIGAADTIMRTKFPDANFRSFEKTDLLLEELKDNPQTHLYCSARLTISSYTKKHNLTIEFIDDLLDIPETKVGQVYKKTYVVVDSPFAQIFLAIFISLFSIFAVVSISITIVAVVVFFYFRVQKKLKLFKNIEDIDIILEESKVQKEVEMAKLKINNNLFKIEFSEIKLIEEIGKGGSSATIFRCSWKNQECAFKYFRIHQYLEEERFREFEKEVEILASVHFPFILKFYGASLDNRKVGIVMEYAKYGDLINFFHSYKKENQKSYSIQEKIRMCLQISSALEYLHSRDITHRDIKPQNVLVTSSYETRLMDFGCSKALLENENTRRVGTSFYMAPEIHSGNYDKKIDSFSFAMLLFVFLTENINPFNNQKGVEYQILNNPDFRPQFSGYRIPKKIEDLIKRNWSHDPSKRDDLKTISLFFSKYMESEEKEIGKKEGLLELKKRIEEQDKELKNKNEIIEKQKKEIQKLKELLKINNE